MHKINTAILTRFLFIGDSTKEIQSGKTVTYEIRKPDDSVFASGNMNEIGITAIYKKSWTPNIVGWWLFKISCASPVANNIRAYFVESGLEKDVKDLLEDATYGLSAIETLVDGVETGITQMKGTGFDQATDALSKIRDAIDALNDLSQAGILSDATPFAGADIAIIKAYVDTVESSLNNGTYGLSALNTKLIAIQADLDNPNQYKADVSGLAPVNEYDVQLDQNLSTTESNIRGGSETLESLKDLLNALNNITAASVWAVGTRTLTDPDSYKADVSALALEATLSTHDTDVKADIAAIKTEIDHATYGLSALETLVDEVESLLKDGTYGLSALNTDIDKLLTGIIQGTGTVLPANKSLYDILFKDRYTDESGSFNWDTSVYLTNETDISALFTTPLTGTTRRKYAVYIDLTGPAGDGAAWTECTIKLKIKVDGSNYRTIDKKVIAKTDVGSTNEPTVPIDILAIAQDCQITIQFDVALASDRTIYYHYVKENMEY